MNELKKHEGNNALFFFAYAAFILMQQFRASFFISYTNAFFKYYYAFLFIPLIINELKNIRQTRYCLIECFSYALLFVLSLLGGLSGFPFVFAFLFFGRHIDYRKITVVHFYTAVLSLIFIVINHIILLKFKNGIFIVQSDRGLFGFGGYPHYSAVFLCVYMMRVYWKKNDMGYFEIAVWFLLSFLVFIFTNAKAKWYSTIILSFLLVLLKIKPDFFEKNKAIPSMMKYSFVVIAAISLFLMVVYDESNMLLARFNTFLTTRLYLANASFRINGISFLPRFSLPTDSLGYYTLDNMYVNWLIKYGIVFFCAILFLLSVSYNAAKERKDWYLFVLMFVSSIISFSEMQYLLLLYNNTWFAIPLFFRWHEESKRVSMEKTDEGMK